MSNTANAITALGNLKTLITNLETNCQNIRTGSPEIDAETRRLLTVRLDQFMAAIFDGGSRSLQNATAAARSTANNGLAHGQDMQYTLLDAFLRQIDAQVAILNNPAQTARRTQTALQ